MTFLHSGCYQIPQFLSPDLQADSVHPKSDFRLFHLRQDSGPQVYPRQVFVRQPVYFHPVSEHLHFLCCRRQVPFQCFPLPLLPVHYFLKRFHLLPESGHSDFDHPECPAPLTLSFQALESGFPMLLRWSLQHVLCRNMHRCLS